MKNNLRGQGRNYAVAIGLLVALGVTNASLSKAENADFLNKVQMTELITGKVLEFENKYGTVKFSHKADGTYDGEFPDQRRDGKWWVDKEGRLCHEANEGSGRTRCANYKKIDGQKYTRVSPKGRVLEVKIYKK